MLSTTVLALAGLFAGSATAAPVRSLFPSLAVRSSTQYHMYSGDGSAASFWPDETQWVGSLDELFALNAHTLTISCTQFSVPNNTPTEIAALKSAIQSISSQSSIDARFIFAIMMQESKGCVRAPTTNNGVRNPGLFQAHNGAGTCNEGGRVQFPCPDETIRQMVADGVTGTAYGDGLKQLVSKAGGSGGVERFYRASRMYNSGSLDASGDLGRGIATHCYSSDIANRLRGWADDAPSACCLDRGCAVEAPRPGPGAGAGRGHSGGAGTPTGYGSPFSVAGTPSSSPTATNPADGNLPPYSTPSSSSLPNSPSCTSTTIVSPGDTCSSVAIRAGIDLATFMRLNPGIDQACGNLLAGSEYCVA